MNESRVMTKILSVFTTKIGTFQNILEQCDRTNKECGNFHRTSETRTDEQLKETTTNAEGSTNNALMANTFCHESVVSQTGTVVKQKAGQVIVRMLQMWKERSHAQGVQRQIM